MLLVWLKLWFDKENGWPFHFFIFGCWKVHGCAKCSSSAGISGSPRRWVVTDMRVFFGFWWPLAWTTGKAFQTGNKKNSPIMFFHAKKLENQMFSLAEGTWAFSIGRQLGIFFDTRTYVLPYKLYVFQHPLLVSELWKQTRTLSAPHRCTKSCCDSFFRQRSFQIPQKWRSE